MGQGPEAGTVTGWLRRWSQGEAAAGEVALEQLYGTLRRLAQTHFLRERRDHTLQPTALVHEAYLILARLETFRWRDRAHFLALSSAAMRRCLIDHGRGRRARKRGGFVELVRLDGRPDPGPRQGSREVVDRRLQAIALGDALGRLAQRSPGEARVVELRFFLGLTLAETAQLLGVSRKTIDRRWRRARAWLYGELGGEAP